tara:strand:+ start:50 stop:862 length:813 start_codon:yes stop_codon:yes gene_type:complete
MPSISVIISTYNKPHFLEKVLTGYCFQTFKNFEIIIADDGSSSKTKEMIKKFERLISQKIYHVWHEDNGFRKCKILNKAIQKSSNEYLIFTDGDCIPDKKFVENHSRLSRKGCFLSGGHFPLNEKISNEIKLDDIKSQKCFSPKFIFSKGQPFGKDFLKLTNNYLLSKALDIITLTRKTFNGNNSSAWREDIIFSNGFDERMGYGSEDNELGFRLVNNNIKPIQVRNRIPLLHLFHERPYKSRQEMIRNKSFAKSTIEKKKIKTKFGIYR